VEEEAETVCISAIFMSRTEVITCLKQIVTLRGCEERMGDQWGTNDVTIVARAVAEKAHLGMKRR